MELTGNKVLVKVDKEEKTVGGLILSDETRDRNAPMTGTVIATGSGSWTKKGRVPLTVTPGDKVLFPSWAGQKIESKESDYLIMPETHIIGILGEDND